MPIDARAEMTPQEQTVQAIASAIVVDDGLRRQGHLTIDGDLADEGEAPDAGHSWLEQGDL